MTQPTAIDGNLTKGQFDQGTLYVVATPIGNLGDITQRAQQVLSEVDVLLAEDTRHTKRLLEHLGLRVPLESLHEHNERQRVDQIVGKLAAGERVALVSDAGTPLISDPGYHLVTAVREQGYKVVPVPGASALTTALSVAGLPTDRFIFEGFLPSKGQVRLDRLEALRTETRTLVFYEAPHRALMALEQMSEAFGEQRRAVVCRELTKTFETIQQGSLADLKIWMAEDHNQQKGEFVLVVAGADKVDKQGDLTSEDEHLLRTLAAELPLKQAAKLSASITGKAKKSFYNFGLSLNDH